MLVAEADCCRSPEPAVGRFSIKCDHSATCTNARRYEFSGNASESRRKDGWTDVIQVALVWKQID